MTMKDWGELWLNEGFATYFENVGASLARPNFAYYDTFYSDFATTAMEEDAYPKSTHPLATLTGEATSDVSIATCQASKSLPHNAEVSAFLKVVLG